MKDEKVIIEVNPRTKEKKVIDLLEYKITKNFTVSDLVEEHKIMKKQIEILTKLNTALIDVISKIDKSIAVQIADIKEEIKK